MNKVLVKGLLLIGLWMILPQLSPAQAAEVISAEGRAVFSDFTTPAEAKAIALNNARRNALEKATGMRSHGDTLAYDSAVIDPLIELAARASISREKIMESSWEPRADVGMGWRTKIEASIAVSEEKEKKTFKITDISVWRPGTGKSDSLYHPSEKIQVKTKFNEKGFLHLFGIDRNGIAHRLYPVRFTEQELILGGQEYVFPTEHEMKFGLKIRVSALQGMDESFESVMAVATKKRGTLLDKNHMENATITDILMELSSMDNSEWAVKSVTYRVIKE